MNGIFYIAGPDGSGKTSYLTEFEQKLVQKGFSTKHIWIRSPKILSKPLMGYCRLVGLTKYSTINGIKYCRRQHYKSALVSWLFPILQLIDFKIKWFFEKKRLNKGSILLFDRFNLDTMADLMVDTKKYNLHKTWVGKQFLKMTPENIKIIFLKVNENTIRSRKSDTLHDEHLQEKIEVFKILSEDLKIKVIDNNRDFNLVKQEIFNFFDNV